MRATMTTIKQLTVLFVFLIAANAKAQTLKDAIKYMDNEQYEKAQGTLKKLITAEPNNGDNYFWFGENYFKTDDLDSAKMMYDAGLKKNPSNALCMVGVGKILWSQNKNEEARKMFYSAGVVLGDKTNKMSAEQKATVCLKIAETYITSPQQDLKEAEVQINKAAVYDPKDMQVHIMMGDLFYQKNQVNASDAISEYKKAAELDKNSPVPYFKKGQLYLLANNPEAAQAELDQSLKVDSMFAPAYRVKAEAFYYRNQMDKALNAYKKYLSINSGNMSARVRYASFLYVAKKYAECITECKACQKDGSTANLLNRLIGYCSYETGDCAGGLAAMNIYFSKQPKDKIIELDYEYSGKLEQKCGKDSLAVLMYQNALKKDSTKTELWGEIGNIYKKEKKYPEAIVAYKTKIAKGGKSATVNDWFFLGQIYFYHKDFEKADSAFMKYTEVQKDIYLGYIWRGRCNAAIDSTNKTWQAHPHYEMAILKSKAEDPKKDMEEAYYYMGLYYFKSAKEYGFAKCCFQKVMDFKLNTDKKDSRYAIAKSSLELGELKNAAMPEKCIKE